MSRGFALRAGLIGAEHGDHDAVEAVVWNFWPPLSEAFIALGRIADAVDDVGGFLRVFDNQAAVELEAAVFEFLLGNVEKLKADFGVLLADAGEFATDDDFVLVAVDVAGAIGRDGDARQPGQPHVVESDLGFEVAAAGAFRRRA